MRGFRPQLWPTLFSVPMLLLLIGLGVWQIQRLHWKEGLIAARQQAGSAMPVPAPKTAAAARRLQFFPVAVTGHFLNDKEILVHAISRQGADGYHVYTPLVTDDGRTIIVDRGFVPVARADPAKRAAGQLAGTVQVIGLVRLPVTMKPGWFLPDNNPAAGLWFWPDLKTMAAHDHLQHVAPFTIDADAMPNPGGWPRGGVTRLKLRNHHLQYAITWFSLAVALIVIYVLYHRRTPAAR
ncbi:MAG TPA: SURF1 family protein [Acetobacteraceae bacterium]|nr:SURF1 family protein [Acetobacteraceae bacterium]